MNAVKIPLTRNLVAIVDSSDAERVLAHKWVAAPSGHTFYAQRTVRRADGGWTTQHMHRFITGYAVTDHRNGDGLDNRRQNLRESTHGENLRNQRLRANTSGFKGVTWFKSRRVWKAQIGIGGKNRHIGYYRTAEEAARAYDTAARELHGEFATLNFAAPGERAA